MVNQNILSEEQIDSKIYNNKYPFSKYFKGQRVIAQKNRLSNPEDLTFCPGVIEEIYDNNTYLIQFENNESKIITKKYFYAENYNSADEMKNYELYFNQTYGIGAKVKANINENNDQLPQIENGVISKANYDTKTFEVTFPSGAKINNVPLEHIYNNCNYYIPPPVEIKYEEENVEEEEVVVKKDKQCQELRFDSLGFLISKKKWIGVIIIFLSFFTILISLKKIYHIDAIDPNSPNHCPYILTSDPSDNGINKIIKKILTFGCKILNNKFLKYILRFVTYIIIFILYFFIVILLNKKLRSTSAIVLYITIGILILFLFQINNSTIQQVIDLGSDSPNIMNFILKLGWAFLISFSIGPIYLIFYFLFIIPNYILKTLNYSGYGIDFMQYIFGKRPQFLSILLYFVLISISFGLYIVLISHCFNDVDDLPRQYSEYDNLTLSLKFRIIQILNGIQTYIKNNLYTIIYISVVVIYLLLKYYIPKTFLGNNSIVQMIANILPVFNTKVLIYLIVFYFILKLFIWKIWPSLKKLDFQALLKELHLDGFVAGLKDANKDITTQQYSLKNLPPNQIYDLGNIK